LRRGPKQVIAIRGKAIVQAGGLLEVHSPDLPPPGTQSDVLVVFESVSEKEVPLVPLQTLIGSCRGMFANPEEADVFLSRERDAWGF
jgi:hypothetical protein